MGKKDFAVKSPSFKSSSTGSKVDDGQLNKMIQERAYYLWEEWGRPEGKDQEIWFQAEKDIRRKLKK